PNVVLLSAIVAIAALLRGRVRWRAHGGSARLGADNLIGIDCAHAIQGLVANPFDAFVAKEETLEPGIDAGRAKHRIVHGAHYTQAYTLYPVLLVRSADDQAVMLNVGQHAIVVQPGVFHIRFATNIGFDGVLHHGRCGIV